MRRFFCLVLILSLADPVPGVCRADELRPIQEGSQQTGLEQQLLQAGAEEKITVYLDPKIKNGRLADDAKPFMKTSSFYRGFWKYPKIQRAKTIVIAGKPTYQLAGNPLAHFYFGGTTYSTDLPFDSKHKQRLFLVVDVLTQLPTAAYDMDSGKQVYTLAEKVKVYLNPVVENGRLKNPGAPVRAVQFLTRPFWAKLSARTIGPVALEGMPTSSVGAVATAAFFLDSETYITDQRFDPKKPLRLLVLADPAARVPLAAYDLKTGRQVYSPESRVQVYLDPEIKQGLLAPGEKPVHSAGTIHPSFWEQEEVRTASAVVFSGVKTYHADGMAKFNLAGKIYLTRRHFDPKKPFRLLVVADPLARIPVAAYDLETGERVYDAEDFIRVYLDPRIEEGFLLESEKPALNISDVRAVLWNQPEIKASKAVAFYGVSTYSGGSSMVFSLGKSSYLLPGMPSSTPPFKLLVLADPQSRAPTAAYDLASGKQVYDVEKLIQVYLDPVVSGGRLVEPGKPFRSVQMLTGHFWKAMDLNSAGLIALKGLNTRSPLRNRVRAVFQLFGRTYATMRRFDAKAPLRLLVLADPRERRPVVAYDVATGEQVYPVPGSTPADERLTSLADLAEEEPTQAGAEENLKAMLDLIPDTLKLSEQEKAQMGRRFDEYLALERFVHFVGEPPPTDFWDRQDPQAYKNLFRRLFGEGRNYPPGTLRSASLQRLSNERSKSVAGPLDILLKNSAHVATYLDLGEQLENSEKLLSQYFYTVEKMATLFFVLKPGLKAKLHQAFNAQDLVEFHLAGKNQVDRSAARRLILSVDGLNQLRKELLLRQGPEAGFDMGELSQSFYGYEPLWPPHTVYGARQINFPKTIEPEWIEAIVIPESVQLSHEPGEKALMPLLEPYLNVPVGGRPLRELLMTVGEYKRLHQARFKRAEALRRRISRVIEGARERQAGAEEKKIFIYVDPVIKNGQLLENAEPYRFVRQVKSGFWRDPIIKAAHSVALAGVTIYSNDKGAFFSLGKWDYPIRSSLKQPVALLVVVNPRTQLPVSAYNMATGELVYSESDMMQIYLDPKMENGRPSNDSLPYRYLRRQFRPELRHDPKIRRANMIVLANFPVTEQQGITIFRFLRTTFSTTKRFDPTRPGRLTVVVDPAAWAPVSAYDQETGEQVYSATDLIRIYLDPPLNKGKLRKDPKLFKTVGRVRPSLWKDPEIHKAKTIAFYNIPTYNRSGVASFTFSGKHYPADRPYRVERPLRLLVLATPESQHPVIAYDQETGKVVYPGPGWIRAYADPQVKNGRLEENLEPIWVGQNTRSLWSNPAAKEAQVIGLLNLLAYNMAGKAGFYISTKPFITTRPFKARRPLRLLVLVDPKTQTPLQAFEVPTGEEVYSTSDSVRIYLDPALQGGRLLETSKPFRSVGQVRGSLWDYAEVKKATTVVLENIRVFDEHGWASFSFMGNQYRTGRRFDSQSPLSLLLVVKTEEKNSFAAYDMATGDQVYPRISRTPADPRLSALSDLAEDGIQAGAEEKISVFLNPKIKEGRLTGDPAPFKVFEKIQASFWDLPDVKKTAQMVWTNVGTSNIGGTAYFSVRGRPYRTNRSYGPENSLRLMILFEQGNDIPIAAYDSAGKEVYSLRSEDRIQVYLDTVVKQGRLVGHPSPWRGVSQIRPSLWKDPKLEGAENLVFSNVPTRRASGTDPARKRPAVFNFAAASYRTTREFDPKRPLKLLVVADLKTEVPIAAYDLETGQQVYSREQSIQIHLNPQIEDGKIVAPENPFRVVERVPSIFWDEPDVREAETIAFSPVATFELIGQLYFHLANRRHRTLLAHDPEREALLLVLADPESREPIEAYDMATGNKVFEIHPVQVFLNPKIEGGKLAGNPEPAQTLWKGMRNSIWTDKRISKTKRVALAGIRTFDNDDRVAFHLAAQTYRTNLQFDPGRSVRLLLVADVRTRMPVVAYELESGDAVRYKVPKPDSGKTGISSRPNQVRVGKRVYKREKEIAVYLNPEIENGLLQPGQHPFRKSRTIPSGIWSDPDVLESERIAVANAPTYSSPSGKTTFSISGKRFITDRSFDKKEGLKLLLVVDPRTKTPIEVFDMKTGERVYALSEQIQILIDPEIRNGRLAGEPPLYRAVGSVPPSLWDEAKVQGAERVVFSNFPVFLIPRGNARFSFAGLPYLTSKKSPKNLLLVADPKTKKPLVAYDMATGEQIYPVTEAPADPRLGALADLAGDEPAQAGAEEKIAVKLFLNAQIRDGRLEGDPEPAGIFKRVSLKDPRIPDSESVVFSGVPTFRAHGTATFQVSKRHYLTTRSFDPEHPLVLLLELDPATRRPLAAYDLANGERVFLEADLLQVYLDVEVVDGRLVGSPNPYRLFHSVPSAFFANPAVRQVGQVVFANVPTHKDGSGLSRFSLAGRTYRTPRVYDPESPLKLIALVNPKTTRVTAAYDMGSGEKVYSEENLIHIYLSPSLKDGRLEGDPLPDEVTARISDTFWKDPQVRQAKTVVFTGVVASPKGKTAVFYLNRQPYWTSRQADPENPLRLLVQANPRTRIPLAAYDMETGEQVYPVQELVQIYLDPPLEKGLLTGDPTPFRTVRSITADLWDLPEVSRSKAVAFADVRAGSAYGWATFFIAQHSYQTDRRFDQSHPLKLLVLVDPRNRLPSAAYDMQTGKKIFPPAGRSIEVYVDPEIQDGKLQEDSLPVWRLKVFKFALLKKSQVQQADTLVIKGVPVFFSNGRPGFQVGKTSFYTRFPLDPKQSEKLLVVINPKEPLPPRAAYLVRTGEQIYPAASFPPVDLLADYVFSRTQLAADFLSGERFYRKRLSPAIEEVVRGDSSLTQVTLSLGGEKLPLTLKKRLKRPAVWTLARDQGYPDSPPEVLIRAAQAFGFFRRPSQLADTRLEALTDLVEEEDKPAQAGAEEDIRIYLDPEIKDGKLAGSPTPFRVRAVVQGPFWDIAEVAAAKVVALENVGVNRRTDKGAKPYFSLTSRTYGLTRAFQTASSAKLLVLVDPQNRLPTAAYDAQSGEQVFSDSDLIQVYLNPVLHEGRLEKGSKPIRLADSMGSRLWTDIQTMNPIGLAFSHITARFEGKGNAVFRIGKRFYSISRRLDPGQKLQLLVLVDPQKKIPTRAYDMESGEQVYSEEGRVGIYLDPVMENGKLIGDPEPYKTVKVLGKRYFKPETVRNAGQAVLSNVRVYRNIRETRRTTFFFTVLGKPYGIDDSVNFDPAMRLLVVLNPKTGIPTVAYDQETGRQLFSAETVLRAYLNPSISGGKLEGDPKPFWAGKVIFSSFWNQPKVQEAKTVVLANLVSAKRKDKVGFSTAGLAYSTTRDFGKDSAETRLMVVIDPQTREPIAAYDQTTGEQIYFQAPEARSLKIYLDPEMQDGRLVGDPKPVATYRKVLPRAFWKNLSVQASKMLVVSDVPLVNASAVDIAGERYPIDTAVQSEGSEYVTVVMDPATRGVTKAYDSSTGKQVYPGPGLIKIYLEASVKDGRLEGDPPPYRAVGKVQAAFWARAEVKQARRVVFTNYPSFIQGDNWRQAFSMASLQYFFLMPQPESGDPLRLTILADPATRKPLMAWEQTTGRKVFDISEKTADPRLEVLANLADESDQAGAEEAATRAVRSWRAEVGTDGVILSPSLLKGSYAEGLKAALKALPPDLAKRVYLAGNWEGLKGANRHLNVIPNGSADDVAVAVGQQVPVPEKVWLVGEFTPVYSWMLKQMGLEPEKISSGADIQEFLAQLGILLGVPEAQVQSGVEDLRRLEAAVEGQA